MRLHHHQSARYSPSESPPVLEIVATSEQAQVETDYHQPHSPARSHRAYQINQQLVQVTPATTHSLAWDDRRDRNDNSSVDGDNISTCPIRSSQSPTTPTPAPRKSLHERRMYQNLIDLSLTASDNNLNINNTDTLFQQQQYQSYQKLHQQQQQQQQQQQKHQNQQSQQFYSDGNIYEAINYEQLNNNINNKQITTFKIPTSTTPPVETRGLEFPSSHCDPPYEKARLFLNGESLNLINYGKLTKDCNKHIIYLSFKKDPQALGVGDREWLSCKMKNVFLGKTLVDWLEKNVSGFKSRQEACKLAKEFLSSDLIESPFTGDKKSFSERRYYGFMWNL